MSAERAAELRAWARAQAELAQEAAVQGKRYRAVAGVPERAIRGFSFFGPFEREISARLRAIGSLLSTISEQYEYAARLLTAEAVETEGLAALEALKGVL